MRTLLPETYGQSEQMTVTSGPETNAEECGHWYSPAAVKKMIEAERKVCESICDSEQGTAGDAADKIRARSNAELTGAAPAQRPVE